MLIAFELAPAVDVVIGPVASVREALELLSGEEVHAAILDVRLVDRDVAPIAAVLLEEGKRVVFHAASQVPQEIADRFGPGSFVQKPTRSDQVIALMARVILDDES